MVVKIELEDSKTTVLYDTEKTILEIFQKGQKISLIGLNETLNLANALLEPVNIWTKVEAKRTKRMFIPDNNNNKLD